MLIAEICTYCFNKFSAKRLHSFLKPFLPFWHPHLETDTAWNISKYGVFSGPYFPAFILNTERYFVSLRIQSECGKTRTRKNSVFGHISRSEKTKGFLMFSKWKWAVKKKHWKKLDINRLQKQRYLLEFLSWTCLKRTTLISPWNYLYLLKQFILAEMMKEWYFVYGINPFSTRVPLLYHLKTSEIFGFLTLSRVIEVEHWLKMG